MQERVVGGEVVAMVDTGKMVQIRVSQEGPRVDGIHKDVEGHESG